MVRWLKETWGHVVLTGLHDASWLPQYVKAISNVFGVNLLIFGFIDCTIRGCRRVTYGQRAIYSGHMKKHLGFY